MAFIAEYPSANAFLQMNTAGAHEPGDGDDQLNREEKQVPHRHGRLPETPCSARLLVPGGSRYD